MVVHWTGLRCREGVEPCTAGVDVGAAFFWCILKDGSEAISKERVDS